MSEFDRIATTAERIRLAMEAAGKRQADLVRETGIDKGALSHYLKGKYKPKQDVVYKLAKALDVSVSYLIGQAENPDDYDTLDSHKSSLFRERVSRIIAEADTDFLISEFGTIHPFKKTLDGTAFISFDKADEIASSLGVSLNYLIGITDDPDDGGPNPAAILAFEKWGEQVKKETLQEKERIEREVPDKIKGAQAVLLAKAMEICKDTADLDEAQQLHELELMPSRIGCIIDFLEANKHFLHKNMPGMIPQDE